MTTGLQRDRERGAAVPSASGQVLSRLLLLLPLGLALLGATTGCTALSKYDASAEPAPFSATANNLGAIYVAASGHCPQRRSAFDFVLHQASVPVWVATLPVSAAFDVITAPYDLLQSDRESWAAADERRWEKFRAVACRTGPDESE